MGGAGISLSLPVRLPVPGPACGDYPQRDDPDTPAGALALGLRALADRLSAPPRRQARRRFVAAVRRSLDTLPAEGSAAAAQQLHALRAQLGRDGFTDALLAPAFAVVLRCVRAVAALDLYDTQIIAARILLDSRLAEMATGEGKTHATLLAAAVAALAGVPVHVVTANPYLAGRDAERLAPVYRALGLSVAAIAPQADDAARREVYRHDVVYGTASDLIFDYLRDQTDPPGTPPRLRGLCMALVDEADGVLIDEARTPFILAEARTDAAAGQRHRSALALAGGLRAGTHFEAGPVPQRLRLTATGRDACQRAAGAWHHDDPLCASRRHREELVELALSALHAHHRDVHYLLREGPHGREVAIIDATTGRVAEGRRWSGGLHQLVELKEGCTPSPPLVTRAQLTYQRFFPRYWRLGGMSGTLREARAELLAVYGLRVEVVPLRLPSRRTQQPARLFVDSERRWAQVVADTTALRAAGRAVLVGTDSVADAQRLSQRLAAAGVPHQRLDARQDAREAECVAAAGAPGCVTVATNMAGRGTDIALDPQVAARGGLHVIACQQNASARIDRQLHGRAARAGDPGSVSTLLALDDGLLARRLAAPWRALLARTAARHGCLPPALARALLRWVQGSEERRARTARARLLATDRRLIASLGFGALTE